MKALIISSLVFFSLRAMSGEVGEDKKAVCEATASTSTRAAKVVIAVDATSTKDVSSSGAETKSK